VGRKAGGSHVSGGGSVEAVVVGLVVVVIGMVIVDGVVVGSPEVVQAAGTSMTVTTSRDRRANTPAAYLKDGTGPGFLLQMRLSHRQGVAALFRE
jgi:hypothetical protein